MARRRAPPALAPPHKGEGRGREMAEFFARPRPFLPGDFVTTDQGTGLVHMAPDHGEDDFELCSAGIDPVFAVDAGGFYRPDWLWLGGQGRSSTTSSTRLMGRSARTCGRRAHCSRRAPTSSTATRIAGGRKPRSSTAAPRNGSSRWTGRCLPGIARASPSSAGTMRAVRSSRRRRCGSWR